MAQIGIHGLIGLAGRRFVRGKMAGACAFGFVLGNLLPDTDFFPLVITFLFNPELALSLHRSFSHSLLTAVLVAVLVSVAWGLRNRNSSGLYLGVGLGIGMALHSLVDIIVWFSGVELFWPLGAVGLESGVNLWKDYHASEIIRKLLGAADYPAAAFFLLYLRNIGNADVKARPFLVVLSRAERILWVLGFLFAGLALVLPITLFEIIHYAIFTLALLPFLLYAVVSLRRAIELSVGLDTPPTAGYYR